MKKGAIDGLLAEWDQLIFNAGDVRRRQGRIERGPTGRPIKAQKTSAGEQGPAQRAENMRSHLRAIVRRGPEVIVKISGGGNGMRQIKAHFDYISRNGKIEIEDQDGLVTTSRQELLDFRDSWQNGGYPVPEEGYVREAFNIVLSMPDGTDEVVLKRAARDFAAVTFPNYQYAMALHTFDTDPDPEPAKHPHVHLVVKARSIFGVRLNPRKDDLQTWREGFAKALADHGIEAAATPRRLRQQPARSVEIGVRKAALRQGREVKPVRRSVQRDRDYETVLAALARSEDREDRRLAAALEVRLDRYTDRGR